jgi:hypothetical protein
MYDIKNLKATKSILKGQQTKLLFFSHLVVCIHKGFKFVAPSVGKKCKKNHDRKQVKMYIKYYIFIFCFFGFLPKYLFKITYTCEKSPPP